MESLLLLLFLLSVTSSSATDLLLWAEEVDTGNPAQPTAKIQTLPADPTAYAPGLISAGEIKTSYKYNVRPGKFVALDTDHQDQVIFFSASLRTAIFKGTIDTDSNSASKVFGGSSKRVEGIAVDWLAKNLYIIDQTYNWIFLINHRENGRYVILVREGLDKPRDIVVHPVKGLLFWSDCGKVPKIERSNLDGTNRTSLIATDITSPNGLSVDYVENRLYWTDVDEEVSKVESCDLDGTNRRVLFKQSRLTSEFYKLKVHKEYVYITDWGRKLWCIRKASGETYFSVNLQSRPHGVTVYGDDSQVIKQSPCLSNPCSNICTSAENGGYKCLCKDSYYLLPDGKTCEKDNLIATPLVFYSNQTSVGKLPSNFPNTPYPDNYAVDGILNNQRFVVAVQADVARRILFFSDEIQKSIFSLGLKIGGKRKLVAGKLGSVQGIAVDYLSQTLYWTDSRNNHIMVSSYDGQYRNVLIDTAIVQPRSIAVDPIQRYMFWLELGSTSHIERARLDGTGRKIIVNTELGVASGITVDFESHRLYFADRSSGAIQSVDYDGQSRHVSYVKAGALYFDMDIFQDFLIWTEWPPNNGLHVLNRETGEFLRSLPISGKAFGITTLDASRQPNGTSPCMIDNGGCDQICTPATGYTTTCLCSVGYVSGEDGQCNINVVEDNFLLLADSALKRIFQVDLSAGNGYAYTALHMGPFQNPIAVAFDPVDRQVYVSDVDARLIVRSSLVGRVAEVVHRDVHVPDGLAVDHINRLLFWTDGANGTICASRLNGTDKTILLSTELEKPRAIAVDPVRGLLFWTDWGTNAKIESSWMDGTNRQILVDTNIGWPNGLALDTEHQFVYWCDAQTDRIEKVKFDGSQRTLMKQLDISVHPHSLLIDSGYIYFTNWNEKSLMRMRNVEEDKPIAVGEGVLGKLSGLASYRSNDVATGETSCTLGNGGCSKLCLATPNGRTCACPTGSVLSDDGVSCLRVAGCPVEIPNGRTTGCDRLPNATCSIICNAGYQTISTQNATCLPSGEWDGFEELFCVETMCPRLPTPVNAEGDCNRLSKPGEVCNFQCSEGHLRSSGDVRRVCQVDARWSGTDLLCKATTCAELVVPDYGVSVQCPRPSLFRSVCSFQCQPGSDKVGGDEVRVCQADGYWSGQELTCTDVQRCPELTVLPGVEKVLCLDPVPNAVCIFRCIDDHVKVAGSLHRFCQQDGTWSGRQLVCQEINIELKFVNFPQNKSVEVGDLLTETCSVSDPSVDVIWLKGDNVLQEGIAVDGVLALPGGLLFISSVRHIHQGMYSCRATDSNDNIIQQTIFIEVTFDDLLTTEPRDVTVNTGGAHTFTCTLADDSYSITWEKNGDVITSDGHTQILQDGKLIINDIDTGDAGNYACVIMADGDIRVGEVFAVLTVLRSRSGCGTVTSTEALLDQQTRDEDTFRVVSGRDAVRGSAPWMVRLYHFRQKKDFCGGCILNSEWIVTAAHCIEGPIRVTKKTTIIRFADHDDEYKDPEEKFYRIEKIVVQEAFSSSTFNADIAMIKLATPILNFTDYVRPICLPTMNLTASILKPRKLGRINGWGRLRQDGPTPRFMNEVYVPFVGQRKCIASTSHTVTGNMFCAGYEREAKDACKGDSGGPFSILHEDRWYLFGLVSWGEGCGQTGKYGFYTRVPAFLEWINNVMKMG